MSGAPASLTVQIDQRPESSRFTSDSRNHQGKSECAGANERDRRSADSDPDWQRVLERARIDGLPPVQVFPLVPLKQSVSSRDNAMARFTLPGTLAASTVDQDLPHLQDWDGKEMGAPPPTAVYPIAPPGGGPHALDRPVPAIASKNWKVAILPALFLSVSLVEPRCR